MKVLFYRHGNYKNSTGGAEVQLLATAEALRLKGVTVDYSDNRSEDLSGYDLVHVFNSPNFEETKSYFENAIRQNKPLAFSTIFWSKEELAVGIARTAKVKIAKAVLGVKMSKALWGKIKSETNEQKIERWLFESANVLLPNSEGEMAEIKRVYGIHNANYQVVRNAIDAELFKDQPTKNRSEYVLSVGRVENRKNTEKLIKACHNLGYKLVLIGSLDSKDAYAAQCKRLMDEYGFEHIRSMAQKELRKYYYEAKVHAMVSWYETPGLSSMEAACGGCNIVTTDRGSTTEYFSDEAYYCDPFSQKSIEVALHRAMDAEQSLALRKKITKQYTWDGAAEDTLAGYRRIVK